ncbi:hypothetical protein V6N12_070262 [Hibiscus sabdariffa]|uniref:RNase H type-1 domain-containing protein n=1 Tax=Hibiscus sabdariffa TaxID=183260 RepID=A0ABR2FGW8_9ROSI
MWLDHLFDLLSKDICEYFIILAWSLWSYRNSKVHDNAFRTVKDIACDISAYAAMLHNLWSTPITLLPSQTVSWIPPPENVVKVNFDASFNSIMKTSVLEIIIRDADGFILATSSNQNVFIANPEMAEARACEQALILAKDLRFRSVIVEGDALTAITKINRSFEDMSEIWAILQNIQALKRDFMYLSFEFIRSSNNRAAHLMTMEGRAFSEQTVWIEEAPSSVLEVAMSERLGLELLD